MNNNLSPDEQYQVQKLITTREYNNNIAWLLVDYLNQNPQLISSDLMLSIETENVLQEEIVYCSFLSTFCGLDIENNVLHKQIERDYFERSVKKLNIENYTSNPYLKNIHIPEGKILKNWKLEFEKYTPYESFIYRDIILDPDFKEIPQIGFFNKTFKFPAVKQNNREWMAIKPNEIETMKHPLEIVRGNIWFRTRLFCIYGINKKRGGKSYYC